MYSFSFIFLSYFWQRFALYTALFVCVCVCVVCVCVFGVCMCVWKISLSFASVARLLLSLSPPTVGSVCRTRSTSGGARTARLAVQLDCWRCCGAASDACRVLQPHWKDDDSAESPAGRQSDPVYGRESERVYSRCCCCCCYCYFGCSAAAADAARALLLFTFLYFNFVTIRTSCC